MALDRAGLLKGKTFTCYPTTVESIEDRAGRVDEVVVKDGKLITSQGPGTTFAFAYALVEALGADSAPLRESMRYDRVFAA